MLKAATSYRLSKSDWNPTSSALVYFHTPSAAALRAGGLETGQLLGGIFRAEVADPKLGLVGEIKSVEAGPVNDVIAAGKIPVLTSLGLSA